MLFPTDIIPNPIAPLQDGLSRLSTILDALNPANWSTLLESGMTGSYGLLIDQLLADRNVIFDSEVFKSLTLFFASLALIPWVVGMIYHLTRAGDGEKGHGRLWLQETMWVMLLAPSLAAVTQFIQSTAAIVARYTIMRVLGAENPRDALMRLVSLDGLSSFEKGLFVFSCYILIIVIALELTATILALPIGSIAMIVAVPLRWAGEIADALYRSSVGAYAIGIGGPLAVALWFALVIVLTTPAYGTNPRTRSLVGVVALFGAAAAIWPLRKKWNTHIKPHLHFPGGVDAEGGEMYGETATINTVDVTADMSQLERDTAAVAETTLPMNMSVEARVAEEALGALGGSLGNTYDTQPITVAAPPPSTPQVPPDNYGGANTPDKEV
jgi:hypothetical protein